MHKNINCLGLSHCHIRSHIVVCNVCKYLVLKTPQSTNILAKNIHAILQKTHHKTIVEYFKCIVFPVWLRQCMSFTVFLDKNIQICGNFEVQQTYVHCCCFPVVFDM